MTSVELMLNSVKIEHHYIRRSHLAFFIKQAGTCVVLTPPKRQVCSMAIVGGYSKLDQAYTNCSCYRGKPLPL